VSVVAGDSGSYLGYLFEAHRAVVTPRDQHRARRRTQGSRMEIRITQTLLGDLV
jgi:hypothetical protein